MEYEIHELANQLPQLTKIEQHELTRDIRENGQRQPIVVFEGKVLDGRHRYAACRELGIEPAVEDFEGGWNEAITFVISTNLRRRHLKPGQVAMIGEHLLMLRRTRGRPRKEEPVQSAADAAKALNVSEKTFREAGVVGAKGTDALKDAVASGEVSPYVAAAVARVLPKPEQDELVKLGPQAIKAKATELKHRKPTANQKNGPVVAQQPAPVQETQPAPPPDEDEATALRSPYANVPMTPGKLHTTLMETAKLLQTAQEIAEHLAEQGPFSPATADTAETVVKRALDVEEIIGQGRPASVTLDKSWLDD